MLILAFGPVVNKAAAQQMKVVTATVSPELPSLKNKKVLIVYGGWDGHKPDAFAKRMEAWLEKEGAILTIRFSRYLHR